MGRTKGSVNKNKTEKSISKEKNDVSDQVKSKTEVHVPILEAPLMVFVCRRCQGNFYSNDEYQTHNCPSQVYAVVSEDLEAAEEESPAKKSPRKKKSSVKAVDEADEVVLDDSEPKFKKPRKPYKKKEKAPKEKSQIVCEKCGKSFTRKYHLERHLIHTQCNPGNIEREEFHCEVCDKAFSRIDNLRMHLRAHLGVKSRSRDFQCPYCEKAFYGSSLLNIHVRSHTKEKPYLCDWEECGKGFPSSGALTKHRRVHTGEKPYQASQHSQSFKFIR